MKQFLKKLFLGNEKKIRRIKFGAASGIAMVIDIANRLQRLMGLEEREIQKTFIKFSRQCDIFIDIGASDGYYGLVYNKHHPKGEIYLIDADPMYKEVQENNFRINGYTGKVNYISKYVGENSDEKHIALDNLIGGNNLNVFLKIDVDGGELNVLSGVKNVLKNNSCRLIIETHSRELEENCIALLNGYDYKTEIIENAWWRFFIPEERPIPHNRWFSAAK